MILRNLKIPLFIDCRYMIYVLIFLSFDSARDYRDNFSNNYTSHWLCVVAKQLFISTYLKFFNLLDFLRTSFCSMDREMGGSGSFVTIHMYYHNLKSSIRKCTQIDK